MLLLYLLLTLKDEDKKAVKTHSPTPADLKAARERLGINQFQAACLASYKKQQNWSLAEAGTSTMDEDRWVMFQLRSGIHQDLQMIDRSTGIEPEIVYPSRAEQAKLVKYQPNGSEIFEFRSKLKKTQAEMCELARIRFISNWGALESDQTKMAADKWELLQLQLGEHPQFIMKLRDERFSSVSNFTVALKKYGLKQRQEI